MDLDIRSKKFKYSPWIKAVCLLLSVVMIAASGFCVAKAISKFYLYDSAEIFNDNQKPEFVKVSLVSDHISSMFRNISSLTSLTEKELTTQLNKNKESYIENAKKEFLAKKASIIKAELTYVANHYKTDEGAYLQYGLERNYVDSIPDTPAQDQKFPVDPYASETIQAVQKILNYAKGEEFLKYASLVREDAFGLEFYYSKTYSISNKDYIIETNLNNYKLDEEAITKQLSEYFDSNVSSFAGDLKYSRQQAKKNLEKSVNFKYYIKKGDTVLTNMKDADSEIALASSQAIYYSKTQQGVSTKGVEDYYSNVEKLFANADVASVYLLNRVQPGDKIGDLYEQYEKYDTSIMTEAIVAILAFIAAISALVVLLNLSGHKIDQEGISLSFIDHLPSDIHLALSASAIIGIIALFVAILEWTYYQTDYILNINWLCFGVVCLVSLIWLVLVEWLSSVVRLKKSGKSWLKNLIIIRIIIWIFKIVFKILRKIKSMIINSAFRYKPQELKKQFILTTLIIFIANVIVGIFILSAFSNYATELGLLLLLGLFIVDAGIASHTAKTIKNLDKVVVAAKNRTSVQFGGERVPEFLSELNDTLRITSEEVEAAVSKAVKNERTKAELITNVSHDLKTPLTSVISYVNLLKKCDIKDPDALKYIDVLDEKSENLKLLIENLVEASKVSTGNVKLNKTTLNLKELVVQAVVESSPDFESKNIDVRFSENDENVNVFADGPHTYRIVENLVSNAKKYSAPHSRVYVSVHKIENAGVFEIKNISKNPLDISPEELTERFVRGDASRGEEEGNGLGLSIAKQLCSLQDGRLEISIDGDLFKATVFLPRVLRQLS